MIVTMTARVIYADKGSAIAQVARDPGIAHKLP